MRKNQKEKIALFTSLGAYASKEAADFNNWIEIKAAKMNISKEKAQAILESVNIKQGIDVSAIDYCGKIANDMLFNMFKGMPTMSNGGVTFLPNLKGKFILPTMTSTGTGLQLDTCDPVAGGGVILGEYTITPTVLTWLSDFCKKDLDNTYLIEFFAAGSDAPIPTNIMDWILFVQMTKLEEVVEDLIWNGDTTSLNPDLAYFDGYIELFDDAVTATTMPIIAGGAVHSAASIKGQYKIVYENILVELKKGNWREIIKIHANTQDQVWIDEMMTAAALVNNNTGFTMSGERYYYQGIEIVFSWAIPVNTLVAARTADMWIGSDVIGEIATLSAGLYPAPKKSAYTQGTFSLGVAIAFPEYFVYLKP